MKWVAEMDNARLSYAEVAAVLGHETSIKWFGDVSEKEKTRILLSVLGCRNGYSMRQIVDTSLTLGLRVPLSYTASLPRRRLRGYGKTWWPQEELDTEAIEPFVQEHFDAMHHETLRYEESGKTHWCLYHDICPIDLLAGR